MADAPPPASKRPRLAHSIQSLVDKHAEAVGSGDYNTLSMLAKEVSELEERAVRHQHLHIMFYRPCKDENGVLENIRHQYTRYLVSYVGHPSDVCIYPSPRLYHGSTIPAGSIPTAGIDMFEPRMTPAQNNVRTTLELATGRDINFMGDTAGVRVMNADTGTDVTHLTTRVEDRADGSMVTRLVAAAE